MVEIIFYSGLGLIVGSFLNVLAVRTYEGRTLLGRSMCMACGRVLSWHDLIPVLSWMVLTGRCRTCRAPISFLYPLTEFATGAAFLLIGLADMPIFFAILAFLIATLLIAIARYDLSYMLIPNMWAYAFSALALLSVFFSCGLLPTDCTLFLIAGPATAAPFLVLWLVSRGTWMGLGDAKLALGIGWLLGLEGGVVAILDAFVLGAIVGVGLILFSSAVVPSSAQKTGITAISRYTMKSEIPFGPFLVIACFIVWFMQIYGIPLQKLLL